MNLPKEFLTGDKAPFIVTLFAAALSWTAIRTADRLAGTPFIEYRATPGKNEKGTTGVELRLRNITPGSRFECFRIMIAARQLETLRFGDPAEQRHTIRGTVFSLLTATKAKPAEWEIEATNLAPGADIALFIPGVGSGTPLVLVRPCVVRPDISSEEKKAEDAKDEKKLVAAVATPILVERGLTTTFVEYEIAILWSALFVWLLAMVSFARTTTTRTPAPAADAETDGG